MRFFSTVSILFFLSTALFAQPANDECSGAIFLGSTDDFCSAVGEYTMEGATPSFQADPSCIVGGLGNDVWFAFRATRTAVSVRMVGSTTVFPGGTLNPLTDGLTLYEGNCGSLTELACAAAQGAGVQILTLSSDVNPGDIYFIRVNARGGTGATFQMCLSDFEPVFDPISDCNPGVLLCDKAPFIVPFLETAGSDTMEIVSGGLPCGGVNCNYSENQSAWYKWICDEAGSLSFTLTPLNPDDDLDFWVYELPNGPNDCNDKIPLRCMASGEIRNAPLSDWIRCHGPTGLRAGETDDHENCGCDSGDNNFIEPIQMEAGKAYALIVMNFSSTDDGFSIDFGGTGTFFGPEIDFIIDPELENQCDIDEVTFINNSTSGIGTINGFEWNFGNGANIRTEDEEGPHDITYNSFGTKNIVLKITTDAGCSKTLIRELFIESCCDPANTLQVEVADQGDPPCPDLPGGFFSIEGSGGSPEYSFSSTGDDFNPITAFNQLNPGTYEVWVQDIKGCRDSIEVVIDPAPEFVVDAGSPQTVQLGCETNLNATVNGNPPFTFAWDTIVGMSCIDCLDPTVLPPGTTTYTIRAQSAAGCFSVDSVLIEVEVVRPFYIPSAFSPNNDGINDFFTGFAGKQVKEIKRMLVFDRWGNMLFENTNFDPGVESEGWDGMFRGEEMDQYVFAYYFEVEYVDNVIVQYEGDVTLLR